MHTSNRLSIIACSLIALAAPLAAANPVIIDLGPIPPRTIARAAGVNNA